MFVDVIEIAVAPVQTIWGNLGESKIHGGKASLFP